MMYQNDFVTVIKCNGKIMRENKETVQLPFGQEYSILMKNLRAQKAVVSISIDGQDVLKGSQLIINANSELELERFLDNLDEGNKFKFIQKTKKIQEHRGDKIDDGIIRIEFQYEKQYNNYYPNIFHDPYPYHPSWTYNGGTPRYFDKSINTCNTFVPSSTADLSDSLSSNVSAACLDFNDTVSSTSMLRSLNKSFESNVMDTPSVPLTDEGITVQGSKSDQKFQKGYIGTLENEKHVITLQLKGISESGNYIEQPITVKTKKECPTCGTKNKSYSKFCVECGTNLN